MQITTTITAKGQITLPKAIRDQLGVRPGTKVEITLIEGGFQGRLLRRPVRRRIET